VNATDRYRLDPDAWLSEILGRPSWTVVSGGAGSAALGVLSKPGPHFATARVAAADTAGVESLQSAGFCVVDMGLTLDAEHLEASTNPAIVRFAVPDDRARVEAIAGSSFKFSRFHLDPHLPRTLADRVKATWAGNWFRGARGDGMIVAEHPKGSVAGFLQLLWAPGERLVIDLIAVEPGSTRKGLARAMIGFAQARGTGDARRPRGMIVGTQAANIASLRLYESLGFRLRDAKFVLHHHGRLP
jgi:ribosomal protein S18 acetylase RimI-like enzyme